EGELLPRTATQPGAATVRGPVEQEHHAVRWSGLVAEASEVGRTVGTEGNRRIAAEIIRARARHGGIVRISGDPRYEAVRQRGGPRFAAVEGGVDGAATVPVPVVAAGDEVIGIAWIHRDRRLVL